MAQQGLFTQGPTVDDILAKRNKSQYDMQQQLMQQAAQGARDPAKMRAVSLLGSSLGRALGGAMGGADAEVDKIKADEAQQTQFQGQYGELISNGTPEQLKQGAQDFYKAGYVEYAGELNNAAITGAQAQADKLKDQQRREALVKVATKLNLNTTVDLLNNGGDMDEAADQIRSQEEIKIADKRGRVGKRALSGKYGKSSEFMKRVEKGDFDSMDSTAFVNLLNGKKAELASFEDGEGSIKLYSVDDYGKVLDTTTNTWVNPSELGLNVAEGGDRLKTEFDQTQALRAELDGDFNYSNYKESQLQFSKIKTSAKADSAAGDMSLIFAYMKMLDPDSVVREGEQATAEAARGIPDSVLNLYNKAMNGEKMGLTQRKDFVTVARKLFKDIKRLAAPSIDKIRGLTTKYDLDENDVFGTQDKKTVLLNKFETIDKSNTNEMTAALEALSQDERKILQKMIAAGEF